MYDGRKESRRKPLVEKGVKPDCEAEGVGCYSSFLQVALVTDGYQCAVVEADGVWKTLHPRLTTRTPPRLSGPAASSVHEEYSVVL